MINFINAENLKNFKIENEVESIANTVTKSIYTTVNDKISPIEYDIEKIKYRLDVLELNEDYKKGNKQKKKISVKIKL